MTRLLLATALLTLVHAAPVHAQTEDLDAVADEAGVDPVLLAGALASQPGVDAREYLQFEGLLARPVAKPTGRVACIVRLESQGNPNATNRSSGAAGLGQFLWGTWKTTPQGKAGLSVYDPQANLAAIDWMIAVGRATEFDAVKYYGC